MTDWSNAAGIWGGAEAERAAATVAGAEAERAAAATDSDYMSLAIALAEGGSGFTNPNPLVGAVIVKDGRVIGAGCHERFGDLHAERNALANCTENPESPDAKGQDVDERKRKKPRSGSA